MSAQKTNREENKYKDNSHEGAEHMLVAEEAEELREETIEALKRDVEKLRDPFVVASIISTAVRERENTNRILKNIYARIEAIEEKIEKLEETGGERRPAPVLLPEVDEQIMEFIKQKRKACAEEVQKQFNYKGRNAACARLNALFMQGLLTKAQVGRKVYYFCRE